MELPGSAALLIPSALNSPFTCLTKTPCCHVVNSDHLFKTNIWRWNYFPRINMTENHCESSEAGKVSRNIRNNRWPFKAGSTVLISQCLITYALYGTCAWRLSILIQRPRWSEQRWQTSTYLVGRKWTMYMTNAEIHTRTTCCPTHHVS